MGLELNLSKSCLDRTESDQIRVLQCNMLISNESDIIS